MINLVGDGDGGDFVNGGVIGTSLSIGPATSTIRPALQLLLPGPILHPSNWRNGNILFLRLGRCLAAGGRFIFNVGSPKSCTDAACHCRV